MTPMKIKNKIPKIKDTYLKIKIKNKKHKSKN